MSSKIKQEINTNFLDYFIDYNIQVVIAYAICSVSFWFFWTIYGIGKKYAYFLPEQYQEIPFGDCMSLFVILAIVRSLFYNAPECVDSKSIVKSPIQDKENKKGHDFPV